MLIHSSCNCMALSAFNIFLSLAQSFSVTNSNKVAACNSSFNVAERLCKTTVLFGGCRQFRASRDMDALSISSYSAMTRILAT